MRKLLLSLAGMLMPVLILAQAPCTTPMASARFRQKLDQLSAMNNENQRLHKARELARENCLSSDQVRQVAGLFVSDYNRLEFTQLAYLSTTDRENFYDVYDAFAYFSNVMRLHDYISQRQASLPQAPPPPPAAVLSFPAFSYPDYRHYTGPSSCHPPLSDADFMVLAAAVFNQSTEAGRLLLINEMTGTNCFSTSQVMKLTSLLEQENNRLTVAKQAYHNTFDIGNYKAMTQMFSHVPYQQSLTAFIEQAMMPAIPPPPPPCRVSGEEFSEAKVSIQKQKFNSTKITVAKQIFTAKPCFTTAQVREILTLFSFEESKLEMAKFAWDFCIDKQNYFQVNDVFSFSSSVDELAKYVEGKH